MRKYIIILTTLIVTLSSCAKEASINGSSLNDYRRRDTLPDGVSYYKNVGSSVRYDTPYTGTIRLSGEVFFKTNGKLVQPFRIVSAGWVLECDSGDFNVNSYDPIYTRLVLAAGVVTATVNDYVERLDSGSCTSFCKTGFWLNPDGYCKYALLWMKGIYAYDDIDVHDFLILLMRLYPDYNFTIQVYQSSLKSVYIDINQPLLPQLKDIADINMLRLNTKDKFINLSN